MNNNVTEINGKFYQECQVVMLSTKKASKLTEIGNILIISTDIVSTVSSFVNQHLYILSNEKIKEGDWMYSSIGNCVVKAGNSTLVNYKGINGEYCKKVIATTNPELKSSELDYKFVDNEPAKGFTGFYPPFPRPSNSFLEAYVREFNAGRKIEKVLVEIEDKGYEVPIRKGFTWFENFKIKLAPDNTITIKPIAKQKESWSREEVIKLMDLYGCYCLEAADEAEGTLLKHPSDFL